MGMGAFGISEFRLLSSCRCFVNVFRVICIMVMYILNGITIIAAVAIMIVIMMMMMRMMIVVMLW